MSSLVNTVLAYRRCIEVWVMSSIKHGLVSSIQRNQIPFKVTYLYLALLLDQMSDHLFTLLMMKYWKTKKAKNKTKKKSLDVLRTSKELRVLFKLTTHLLLLKTINSQRLFKK